MLAARLARRFGAWPARGLFALLVCAGALLAGSAPARSQVAVLQQQLFERTLREPLNHELTFEYARVATANGDFEAAIGALERLLFYNPNLTRVKYELGTLYFRMGSFEMAKRYFSDALKDPNLNPVTRERIETYLPDAEKQLQASRFSGYFNTGLRYQSNASFAPSSGALLLGGQEFALQPQVRRQSDWNWYGMLGLSHDYDLQNQRGDILETRFVGYGTHQFRLIRSRRRAVRPELGTAARARARCLAGSDDQALRRRRQGLGRRHVIPFDVRRRRRAQPAGKQSLDARSEFRVAARQHRHAHAADRFQFRRLVCRRTVVEPQDL